MSEYWGDSRGSGSGRKGDNGAGAGVYGSGGKDSGAKGSNGAQAYPPLGAASVSDRPKYVPPNARQGFAPEQQSSNAWGTSSASDSRQDGAWTPSLVGSSGGSILPRAGGDRGKGAGSDGGKWGAKAAGKNGSSNGGNYDGGYEGSYSSGSGRKGKSSWKEDDWGANDSNAYRDTGAKGSSKSSGKGDSKGSWDEGSKGKSSSGKDDGKSKKGGKDDDGKGKKGGKDDGKGKQGKAVGGDSKASSGKGAKGDGKASREEDAGGKYGGGKGASGGKSNGKSGGKSGGKYDDDADEKPPPQKAKASAGTGAVTDKHISQDRFGDLPVSNETRKALAQGFGYEYMTRVQAATIHPMLKRRDVVARAKTGTGKTLAFLVPIIEAIKGSAGGVGGPILALILSPTRELASQIHHEAEVLCGYHKWLGTVCFFGGVNIKGDKNALDGKPCDILVATPGRLTDHLQNTKGFSDRLWQLMFLALDEADQLLDMGFRDAIMAIIAQLPPASKRQGALFSATFPAQVNQIAKLALKADYDMIDTVMPDEEVTPDQIAQTVVVTDTENMMETLWKTVSHEKNKEKKSHKIMVFFVTARLTQYYAQQFNHAGTEVLEIHSRKSQNHRTKCAEQFRQGQTGIIFSSDVLARGLDMPDVTAVIQVGVPSSRDQYIHRLGRTGRAGKSGCCTLLLHDFESFFLKQLKDLPVKNLKADAAFPKASQAADALWEPPQDWKTGGQAYQAWLGYYNSAKGLGFPKETLVKEATRFAYSIGVVGADGLPPPILKKTVGMMGLKGVYGLNIVSQLPYND